MFLIDLKHKTDDKLLSNMYILTFMDTYFILFLEVIRKW